MLLSLAYVFLLGMFLGKLCSLLKLPSLLGMLIAGIILGPFCLNLLDSTLLGISAELRELALVIILTRAGLNLDIAELKKVGRPAVLLCFVPACFEIAAMCFFAPKFFGISLMEAALLGAVIAAVSPAVIVPKMLHLIETKRGTTHSIPQMIMAGASVDDVFVLVLFTSFLGLNQGESISATSFVSIPISLVTGILLGIALGLVFHVFFHRFHMRDSVKVIIFLSTAFIFMALEDALADFFPLSGLIAIMACGITLKTAYPILASRLSQKYSKLWVASELMLFALVGATVDLSYLLSAGGSAVLLLLLVLIFRMLGVFFSLLGTKLNTGEKLFSMVAYCPKATVQAAIGGIPLATGLACGNLVLTIAVLSIMLTAPLGALAIDLLSKNLD